MTAVTRTDHARRPRDELYAALDKAAALLSRSGAGEWEAFASAGAVTTIRFACNHALEAKSFFDHGIGVRAVCNGSIGFASTTGTADKDVERMVGLAVCAAKAKAPDADFHGLPTPKKQRKPSFDAAMRDADSAELSAIGIEALDAALSASNGKLIVSGSTNFAYDYALIKSSTGTDCCDEDTFAYSTVTAERGNDSSHEISGMGWALSHSLARFDAAKAGVDAAKNALVTSRTGKVKPGKYDVVFGEYSVTDITENILSYAVNLASVDYGMSYFGQKQIGKRVASEQFSIEDNGTLADGFATKACDDEGVPTQRTPLIENGVLKGFLCDDYYAKKVNHKSKGRTHFESTGNGFRFDAVPGRRYDLLPSIYPTNLVIKPGTLSDSELFAGIKRGIYVGRTWYTYPVNPVQGDFTCTNRSNTFLIENGEIAAALSPNAIRITDNLPRLLGRVEGVGREATAVNVWGGSSAVITPKLRFSGVTVSYSNGAALATPV